MRTRMVDRGVIILVLVFFLRWTAHNKENVNPFFAVSTTKQQKTASLSGRAPWNDPRVHTGISFCLSRRAANIVVDSAPLRSHNPHPRLVARLPQPLSIVQ